MFENVIVKMQKFVDACWSKFVEVDAKNKVREVTDVLEAIEKANVTSITVRFSAPSLLTVLDALYLFFVNTEISVWNIRRFKLRRDRRKNLWYNETKLFY